MKNTKTPTQDYLDKCAGLIECIRGQADAIQHVADRFAETILAGRMVHVFGCGHSRIMVEEMWPRYGSFPGFNPIVELSLSFHNPVVGSNGQRQAMFLENVSGFAERILRNYALKEIDRRWWSVPAAATSCRSRWPRVQATGHPRRRDRQPAAQRASTSKRADGKKLGDFADVVLDTGAPVGDAMVKLEGLDSRSPLVDDRRVPPCQLHQSRSGRAPDRRRTTAEGAGVRGGPGEERAAEVFEAAYDEHAHRLAKLFADVGRNL